MSKEEGNGTFQTKESKKDRLGIDGKERRDLGSVDLSEMRGGLRERKVTERKRDSAEGGGNKKTVRQ